MHLLASFSSSLCFSGLRFFKNFSGKLFFPGSFINKHFNVGCFHSLCSSILCHYSFCLCQPLRYLITNKSATVNFLLEKQQSSWERLLGAVLYRVDIMSSQGQQTKINFHIMSVSLREGKKQLLLFTKEFKLI